MIGIVTLLGVIAAGLTAVVAIGVALRALWRGGRRFVRGVHQLVHVLSTLAALPAAVNDLAAAMRESFTAHGTQLADHEGRLTRLEDRVLSPSEV